MATHCSQWCCVERVMFGNRKTGNNQAQMCSQWSRVQHVMSGNIRIRISHRRTSLIKWHLTGMTYRKTMSLTLSYIIKPCSSEPNPTKTTYTQNLTRPALSHDRQNPHSKRSQPTSTKQTRPIPEVNKISVVDPTTYTKTRTPSIFTHSSQQSPPFP